MSRGIYRRVAAISLLAVCLTLAVPQSADARLLMPDDMDRVETVTEVEPELTLFERIWDAVSMLWGRTSVMIDPIG